MDKITQDMKYRHSVVKYALNQGGEQKPAENITKAAAISIFGSSAMMEIFVPWPVDREGQSIIPSSTQPG